MLDLPRRRFRRFALLALSLSFVVAGANHFVNPTFYISIMPSYLPAHRELVFLSGALEIVGGVAVLFPRLRSAAGLGLVLLLVGIFPANLHMALNPELFPAISPVALYARLPLQILLFAWAYWATRSE